jgi:glycosyltransferase involved in cell wall biosynthesis
MQPKIFINSNMIWTISQFRLGLIKAFVEAGYEVVCAADTDTFSDLSEVNLASAGARFVRLPLSRKGINPLQDLRYLIKLSQLIRKEKPDLVINYTVKPIVYGSLAARFHKIPSFAVTTGLGFVFTRSNTITRMIRMLYRFSLSFPEKIFFLNNDDRTSMIKRSLVAPKKTVILPSEGINTAYYHPTGTFDPAEPFTFLLIARLLWEKGIGYYVEAARKLEASHGDAVECRLIGYIDEGNPGGISREQLIKWVSEGVINYLGTTDDVRPVIADADCVVLPSVYREGVPRTLMEAAAMGKPLIASDWVGCKEVVDHGKNGYLCKPNDVDDLYNKMVDMMHLTDEERDLMGCHGRQIMLEKYDEAIVIRMYLDEIKKLGIPHPQPLSSPSTSPYTKHQNPIPES